MRRVRFLLIVAGGLAVCVCAAIAFVAWALTTESGTAWLVARIEQRIPAPVTIGRIGGTLWRGLDLRDVSIETATTHIDIDEAVARFDLTDLIRGSVIVDELSVGTVVYRPIERADGSARRGNVSLPIRIAIRNASLKQLVMTGGTQERVLGPFTARAEAAGSRLTAQRLTASGLGFEVTGSGELRFGPPIELDLDLAWETVRDGLTYAGRGSASGTWPTLAFHQELGAPVALEADGEITLAATPMVDLEARWQELAWPRAPAVRSPAGVVRLAGWLDDYEFDADGTVIVDGIESAVTATGTGSRIALDFAALELAGEFGDIAAQGAVELDPLVWALDVQTRALDPAIRLPGWPGALQVTGRFSGRAAPALELALRDMSASGELRGRPIVAEGAIGYRAPARWTFEELTVDVAGNELGVDGSAGAALDLSFTVDAAALERLLPDAAGTIRGAGRLAGTLEDPELNGSLDGRGLRYADYSAESVTVAGEFVADGARTVALSLAAKAVEWRGRTASSITAGITGAAAAHSAELDVVTDYGRARLQAEGAWSAGVWDGQITALSLQQPSLGAWRLTEPAQLSASRASVALDRACLAQGDARVCAMTRIGTADDLTEIEVTAFDLAAIAAALPESYSMIGRYDGRVSLSGPLSRPAGSFETRGVGTVLTIREADEPTPLEIPIDMMEIHGELSQAGALRLRAGLQGGAGGEVEVDAAVPDLWAERPEIDAQVSGRWSELGMLSLISPDVGSVSGTASVDLMLDGPLRSPGIRGEAHWVGGEVAVPRWGLLIEDIDADVSSADGTELLLQASGVAGEGRLEVSGVTQVDPDAGWPTRLQVFGNGLQAVRLPDADILVSPALEVRAALPNVEVNGAFLIPHARLQLDELPPQAVEPSPDTVVHGVGRSEQDRPLAVHANIRVGLGEDVRYSGAGLDVALSGAMGIEYMSGRDAVASGAVSMTGEYQAYGQTLQIDEGQLVFNGPLTNPTLDVRATRRVESRTVGVQLSGTVEAPQSRIFSEPPMNEADALSYLLLGRPLEGSGDAEAASLETAAFAMGLQHALPVIQRVGESLGLDEFSVQTTAADTGQLMAGKRISPRIYLRYTYGLFNRIGGLLMRFNLSQRFSLETRSGEDSSMDLLYTVERD